MTTAAAMPTRPRAVPVIVGVVVPLCAACWVFSLSKGPYEFSLFVPLAVALTVVGAFLTLRTTGNPIGWLLLAWGAIVSYGASVSVWGAHTVANHGTASTAQRWMSLSVPVVWHPGFILFIWMMLLFPNGRFRSGRWKVFGLAALGFALLIAVLPLLAPRYTIIDYVAAIAPPYASPVETGASRLFNDLLSFMLVGVLGGVGSLIVRWRGARGDDRRQITVFVFPTAVALVVFGASIFVVGDGRLGVVLLPVLPISLGVAVLRYKLYAIDGIVSRTVSYGLVTAVVVGVYVGAVQLVGLALPRADSVAAAAATLTAAAVFSPILRRIKRFVDRRFNRERYDQDRLVDAFRVTLRRPDLPDVEAALIDTVARALHPSTSSVWVRLGSTDGAGGHVQLTEVGRARAVPHHPREESASL